MEQPTNETPDVRLYAGQAYRPGSEVVESFQRKDLELVEEYETHGIALDTKNREWIVDLESWVASPRR